MRSAESLSVIVPAFNEESTVERTVRGIDRALDAWPGTHEVLIVDDGSTDATGEIADRIAGELRRVRVIHMSSNSGYGAAQRRGLEQAAGEMICVLPADGQIPPEVLDSYLAAAPRADVIVGAYRQRQDSLMRRLNSRLYNVVLWMLFGVRLRNINAPKLYRRAHLQALSIQSRGGFADAELVIQLHARGRTFAEVEIDCLRRTAGRSTVGWRAALEAIAELWTFRRSGRHRR